MKQMKTNTANGFLKSELSKKGYLHLKHPLSKNLNEIFESLGQRIQKTEIKENLESTRLLVSNQPMTFHTDHYAAKYIAWFCNSQSASGGDSLLVDVFEVFKKISKNSLGLLKEITVKTHRIFHEDKLTFPLLQLDEDDNPITIYYAKWLVNYPGSTQHQKALEKFEAELQLTKPITLLLSEGDLLIIDNHRMLHGRNGFPTASNRWLTRYWLSSNHTNI